MLTDGLDEVDAAAKAAHGASFTTLTADRQDTVLRGIARAEEGQPQGFFRSDPFGDDARVLHVGAGRPQRPPLRSGARPLRRLRPDRPGRQTQLAHMNRRGPALGVCAMAMLVMVLPAAGTGQAPATPLIGGTLTPAKADARGWGWQVKATMAPSTPRPLYNRAKERLLQDKQITGYTITSYDPELYCEVGKHFDYVWFEMQHSTMSYDEVRRMVMACPHVGAAPMIRVPDALESSIQKATDLGALGVIVPTVDDARKRATRRASRVIRRSAAAAPAAATIASSTRPALNYRATINDNMLVTVMIETLEGVAMAEEIAATHGVDVVILGNNDLSSFSGWSQHDPRYQDAIIKVHDAALRFGKYYGNAGEQYLTGYTVSADTRMVQNGPACDGWRPAGRGRRDPDRTKSR